MTLPLWIRTPDELAALTVELAGTPALAIDTEADSLHHYPGKLCLVQLADAQGRGHLVDPLALRDLSPLGPVLADPGTVKVLHAADNDLSYLKRLYGVTVVSLFDTAVAARFLGATSLGLEGLLTQYLGVTAVKSRQKDDWSRRPLSAAQEAYALDDVLHLGALRARLLEELRLIGREEWVEEECAALAAQPAVERVVDPNAFARLKGARELPLHNLAVLRELYELREQLARSAARPPFKILAEETLVRLAQNPPADAAALALIPGCTPKVIGRWGEAIRAAVARGLATPENALPVLERTPRLRIPGIAARRIEALRQWRTEAAPRFGLEPGLLLPNRLITTVALAAPRDPGALATLDGVRRWRVETFGAEIVAALAAP